MSAERLIAQFGYLALFAGAFFEGEAIVITAAFAALTKDARRYEPWTILAVLAVSALAWIGYCLGRRGLRRLAAARRPREGGRLATGGRGTYI